MKNKNLGLFDIEKNTPTLNYKERFDLYKKFGFTHIGFYWDNNYLKNNDTYEKLYAYANEIGLVVGHVHLDYKNSNSLSLNNEEGENYFNYLVEKLTECKKRNISYVVVHASKGDEPEPINSLGLDRVKKLNDMLKNSNTFLCFENVRNNNNLETILNLNLCNIKMCYDAGHANCYSDYKQMLTKYASKIVTTHIHNNFNKDTHNVMSVGNINWAEVFTLLNKTHRKMDYLEIFPNYDATLTKKEFELFLKQLRDEYFYNKN